MTPDDIKAQNIGYLGNLWQLFQSNCTLFLNVFTRKGVIYINIIKNTNPREKISLKVKF